ncbi:MAG: EscN/YscN/HrcN family type III secretion system ATPase [candidate division Zixibacteria bacterium CG_4_9_14_3_um_filter_46_8]|nr:MAG: EscN/YscN/HrcN family type III secretion system ATPase [candidate division Zixibacteria bacterium CG_4_9_14_3_um_filter_46_8]
MRFEFDISEKIGPLINACPRVAQSGRIVKAIGMVLEATGLRAGIGQVCSIVTDHSETGIIAEVVGFRDENLILMALEDSPGIIPGAEVRPGHLTLMTRLSPSIVGRIINGLGNPIDGKGPIIGEDIVTWSNQSPHPLKRRRITEPFYTGVRSIDSLITIGKGQRMGIFAGSGVGKSVLMGMIARNCYGDVNVIGLIGERGREVREFIEKDLGEEGLSRSVVVVVTSDKSPLMKIKGAFLTTAIAEYFRGQGKDALLMMDSLTRVATAQREIGLAAGEPPTTRGYTPSAFALIPKLLERAGASEKGSITGIYTVLVEGDDLDEPVSDTSRATLDGHIVLSRRLANRNHYPAIDVNASISRVMPDVISRDYLALSQQCKKTMAIYAESEDIINIGAYSKGSSSEIDFAIEKIGLINRFLQQNIDEKSEPDTMMGLLEQILAEPEKQK